MGKARRFLSGLRREPGARPAVALAPLCAWIAADVPRWEGATVEPELLRARLADGYRDATLVPLPPATFDALATGLEDEAWRRLALVVDALDFPEVRAALPALLRSPVDQQVREAFVEFARTTELLKLDLLRQSPLRVEEFTRSGALNNFQLIGSPGAGLRGSGRRSRFRPRWCRGSGSNGSTTGGCSPGPRRPARPPRRGWRRSGRSRRIGRARPGAGNGEVST